MNYPNRKTSIKKQTMPDSHMGRGMSLEHDLNCSNDYYIETDRALIHKKPTPIQVVKVDYPKRSCARISEAYYKTPSTTDYNGIYRGRAIDFEAKETKSKSGLTFKSIHEHQIRHLERVLRQGGIGFLIIRFTTYDETYLIDAGIIIDMYRNKDKKSISYKSVQAYGSSIRQGLTPRLYYLDNVDEQYFKEAQ